MDDNKVKSMPLDLLVEADKNIYELTSAAIHRARQLVTLGGEEVESHKGKIVSAALDEMLNDKLKYTLK